MRLLLWILRLWDAYRLAATYRIPWTQAREEARRLRP